MSVLDFLDKQIHVQVKNHIVLNGRTHGQQKFDANLLKSRQSVKHGCITYVFTLHRL